MEEKQARSLKKKFYAALTGTIVVGICCFTPALVLLFVAVGLGAFTRYLDYVLFPALGIFMALTVVSYRRWKRLQK